MKAREISKKIAHARAFTTTITAEELAPHMEGENVTPKRLEKVQDAHNALGESLSGKWKLNPTTKKKR